MIKKIGKAVRRVLPPKTYKNALIWWRYRLYWQQRIASQFVRRTPQVEVFPVGAPFSDLARTLSSVNLLAPTPLCLAMHWQGSDKSLFWHHYTTIYSALLAGSEKRPIRIFELGLGSNNLQFAFNMGTHGIPGASLRGWKKNFPAASVFGADIDGDSLIQEDRIHTFYCDQQDSAAIRRMWSEPDLQDAMDLIVDDGLHSFEGNFTFLTESLAHVRAGGLFVVEDIAIDSLPQWRETLSSQFLGKYPGYEFVLLTLPNRYRADRNNILIVQRLSLFSERN